MKYIITLLLLSACSHNIYQKKLCRATAIYPSVNTVVHKFTSLSEDCVIDIHLDSAICKEGDTLLIIQSNRNIYFVKP